MAEDNDQIWKALSDQTRRSILDALRGALVEHAVADQGRRGRRAETRVVASVPGGIDLK